MKKKTEIEEKKSIGDVMKQFNATLTVPFKDGFASISFSDTNELVVEFLNDEGYHYNGETPIALNDLNKVTEFMKEMRNLRLKDYESPSTR
jgi:hypothetical protein